ncbi:hypothetical protein [Caldanaerobacter subterraneus]|uniref:Uncharacterized protein n=1 Tax=Caldanaerobacter subterraneus TaxID=911092 RepID=A0A7Y2L6W7_9THEO|nr:hypothetical protein [Caldanaerobacter subterraneus]NNG66435.1 hypothetical protein [Caldanaerobacter subterraneus]
MINTLLTIDFFSLEKLVTCKKQFFLSEIKKEANNRREIETGYIIGELLKGNSLHEIEIEKLEAAKIFKYKKPENAEVIFNKELSFEYNNINYKDTANIVEIEDNLITFYFFEDKDILYKAQDSVRALLIGMILYKEYQKNIQIKLILLKNKKVSKYIMTQEDIIKAEDFLMENINRIHNLLLQGEEAFTENKGKHCQDCPFCKQEEIKNNIENNIEQIAKDTAKQIILLEKQLEKLYNRLENICFENNMTVEVNGHIFEPVTKYKYTVKGSILVSFLMQNGLQPLDFLTIDSKKIKELIESPIGEELKELAKIESYKELEHRIKE